MENIQGYGNETLAQNGLMFTSYIKHYPLFAKPSLKSANCPNPPF